MYCAITRIPSTVQYSSTWSTVDVLRLLQYSSLNRSTSKSSDDCCSRLKHYSTYNLKSYNTRVRRSSTCTANDLSSVILKQPHDSLREACSLLAGPDVVLIAPSDPRNASCMEAWKPLQNIHTVQVPLLLASYVVLAISTCSYTYNSHASTVLLRHYCTSPLALYCSSYYYLYY
jgi:hypothetical protein